MKLSDLLYRNEYVLYNDDFPVDSLEVSTVCSDSRRVTPGSLFVCLKGTKTDGHRFIKEAVDAGAAAVVTERGAVYELPGGVPVLQVGSTRVAEAFMWSRAYRSPQN
ncbi:MAG: hypothetical protein GX303_05680 [Clostridiales bacterium]|nr:hypothetical protein [Clostridiales bacterium]